MIPFPYLTVVYLPVSLGSVQLLQCIAFALRQLRPLISHNCSYENIQRQVTF
jgi:hypothetical protein